MLAKILEPLLVPNKPLSLKLSPFVTSDIIGHVSIGFEIYGFLLVVNLNRPSVVHGFLDIKVQIYWGHGLELLGSRDVIGHVTIGLGIIR